MQPQAVVSTSNICLISPAVASQPVILPTGGQTNSTPSFSDVVSRSNSFSGGTFADGGFSRDGTTRSRLAGNGLVSSTEARENNQPGRNNARSGENGSGGTSNRGMSSQQGKRKPMYGTKSGSQLAGKRSELNFSIFVGGISNNIEAKDLAEYIQLELDINPLEFNVNKIDQHNRSFKVIIRRQDKDAFFNPSQWEENIILKPFRERRAQSNDLPGNYGSRINNNNFNYNNGS